ncbi:hypothetical protein ACIBO1_30475 [Micromonospora sp. NPDC049903]|uniref:hypothetical protein n=1 Tax=Micromonospora sp. NPDC049903 TaxID=3364276 RepID=UPI00378CDEBF
MESNDERFRAVPWSREPRYVRRLREDATRVRSVPRALYAQFRRARIQVRIIGDTSVWSRPGRACLLVGDHRDRFELAPLFAMLGGCGRSDVHVIAKSYSMNAAIIRAAGRAAEGIVLPVDPGTLAGDRPIVLNRDLPQRLRLGRQAPTRAALREANRRTIARAAELLVAGHLVTLFPCGAVTNALRNPWRPGLGRLIKQLDSNQRNEVHIVLFRFDNFAPTRLVRRLLLDSHDLRLRRPLRLTLRIGAQGSVHELLGAEAPIDLLTADEITERLRRRYQVAFERPHAGLDM